MLAMAAAKATAAEGSGSAAVATARAATAKAVAVTVAGGLASTAARASCQWGHHHDTSPPSPSSIRTAVCSRSYLQSRP